jgi:hypothetical protein
MAGDGGSGGGPECESLLDDDRSYVPVWIINDTSETLFLGQQEATCGDAPLFGVADVNGRLLTPPGTCRSSCESAMTSGPTACPPVCLLPSAVELAPGDELSTHWAGTYIELVKLPTRCQSAEFPSPQCDRVVAVEPGVFVFSARAGTKLDCSQTGSACMPCMPDEGSACVTRGALITGAIRHAAVEVELDAGYGLGAGNDDGAIVFLEIRFQHP